VLVDGVHNVLCVKYAAIRKNYRRTLI